MVWGGLDSAHDENVKCKYFLYLGSRFLGLVSVHKISKTAFCCRSAFENGMSYV